MNPVSSDYFSFEPSVLEIGVRGIYLTLHGLDNSRPSGEFEVFIKQFSAELSAGAALIDPAADPVLAGFRRLHEKIGRSNKRFPAASESLLRLLQRTGRFPRINTIVDIYNAVSVETRLAFGAHDIAYLEGGAVLRLSRGDERFVPLGSAEPEVIQAGEYGYFDRSGEMICRLEHKQVEKTKVTVATSDCFYVIQGNGATAADYMERAADRLTALTLQFCGGQAGPRWLVV